MNKTQIKNLALLSYKNNKIDIKRIEKIVKLLKKSELRQYIKYLKAIEKTKTIKAILPNKNNQKECEKMLKKVYKGKNVDFDYDENMIIGLKIIDNDLIYEYNLKDTIDKISNHVKQL